MDRDPFNIDQSVFFGVVRALLQTTGFVFMYSSAIYSEDLAKTHKSTRFPSNLVIFGKLLD
jgi:hypothetical protein